MLESTSSEVEKYHPSPKISTIGSQPRNGLVKQTVYQHLLRNGDNSPPEILHVMSSKITVASPLTIPEFDH